MTLRSVIIAALLATALAAPALAQEADLIHADTPLWAPGDDGVWPRHFVDGESFGCTHPMRLGLWRDKAADSDRDDTWRRFDNYGAFHCWMNVSQGPEPENLSESRPGFLVQIDKLGAKELWVLQTGTRPGSDYLLLARTAGTGLIERFEVLQRRCDKAQVRGGPPLDILATRYCAVNSKAEMRSLARRMARLPVLGVITFEREAPNGG